MRIESRHPTKNGGWWHPTGTKPNHEYKPPPIEYPRVNPNLKVLYDNWRSCTFDRLQPLADRLQLQVSVLNAIGAVYSQSHQAYAFPMFMPDGELVGIRLRNDRGEKWAVKGSKAGLFVPWDSLHLLASRSIFLCEGPTDTAAAIQLGFFAIGRHACVGQEQLVNELISEACARHAYVVYDNDAPGVRGADKLCAQLKIPFTRVIPPAKDLREFVSEGGTKELLMYLVSEAQRKHIRLSASRTAY